MHTAKRKSFRLLISDLCSFVEFPFGAAAAAGQISRVSLAVNFCLLHSALKQNAAKQLIMNQVINEILEHDKSA